VVGLSLIGANSNISTSKSEGGGGGEEDELPSLFFSFSLELGGDFTPPFGTFIVHTLLHDSNRAKSKTTTLIFIISSNVPSKEVLEVQIEGS
jgi:hypothetical protein